MDRSVWRESAGPPDEARALREKQRMTQCLEKFCIQVFLTSDEDTSQLAHCKIEKSWIE